MTNIAPEATVETIRQDLYEEMFSYVLEQLKEDNRTLLLENTQDYNYIEEECYTDYQLLVPWLLFEQKLKLSKRRFAKPTKGPLARFFMLQKGKLSKTQKTIIKAALENTFSFLEVVEVDYEKSVLLRDIFTEEYFYVEEENLSVSFLKDEILFAKVIEVEGRHDVCASGPEIIGPQAKEKILKLKRRIQSDLKVSLLRNLDLCAYSSDMMGLYDELVTEEEQSH